MDSTARDLILKRNAKQSVNGGGNNGYLQGARRVSGNYTNGQNPGQANPSFAKGKILNLINQQPTLRSYQAIFPGTSTKDHMGADSSEKLSHHLEWLRAQELSPEAPLKVQRERMIQCTSLPIRGRGWVLQDIKEAPKELNQEQTSIPGSLSLMERPQTTSELVKSQSTRF